ncbi:hypothetical protein TIFTF001_018294 [Ficus carica]|uniref:Uncharacterized protein n=1 Tax=Ficus carica TaxID=3494 RepID=A0AA88A6T3_FICCA|nr:hypothetical protein TIFTF001_018294 [Ficus carica]
MAAHGGRTDALPDMPARKKKRALEVFGRRKYDKICELGICGALIRPDDSRKCKMPLLGTRARHHVSNVWIPYVGSLAYKLSGPEFDITNSSSSTYMFEHRESLAGRSLVLFTSRSRFLRGRSQDRWPARLPDNTLSRTTTTNHSNTLQSPSPL